MRKYLLLALLLFGSMLTGSCIREEFGAQEIPSADGRIHVDLKLYTPQATSPSVRSSDIAEKTLDEVYMCFFIGSTCHTITKGVKDEATGKWRGDLVISQTDYNKEFRCVVLANIGNAANLLQPDTYESFRAKLVTDLSNDNAPYSADDALIPMWGEFKTTISPANASNGLSLSVDMLRSIARADVIVGATANQKFELSEVLVYKRNNKVALIPDENCIGWTNGSPKAVAPSLPSGQTSLAKTVYTATGKTELKNTVYLPEADVVMGGDADHLNRCAIVVGGKYNGSAANNYYRIDFKYGDGDAANKGKLMDVLRNHLYRFTITDVLGPGQTDPDAAYEAVTAAISAEVTPWNEVNNSNVVFDGVNVLSMGWKEANVDRIGGELVQTVSATENLDWTLKLLQADGMPFPNTNSAWIKFTDGTLVLTGKGSGADSPASVRFNIDRWDNVGNAQERRAKISLEAQNGRMVLWADVIQLPKDEVFITAPSLVSVTDAGEEVQVKVDFGSYGSRLYWKVFSADYADHSYFNEPLEGEFDGDWGTVAQGSKTFTFSIPAWPADEDWGTKDLLLSLTAVADDGNSTAHNIIIRQKKKGITLVTDYEYLFATGSDRKVYVLSNFNWRVEYTQGGANAAVANLVTGLAAGTRTEGPATSSKSEQSYFDVATKVNTDYSQDRPKAHFTFTDIDEPGAVYDISLIASPVWTDYSGNHYLIMKKEDAGLSAYIENRSEDFDGWTAYPLTEADAWLLSESIKDEPIYYTDSEYIMRDSASPASIDFSFKINFYVNGELSKEPAMFKYITLSDGIFYQRWYRSKEHFEDQKTVTGFPGLGTYNVGLVLNEQSSLGGAATPMLSGNKLIVPDYMGIADGDYLVDLDELPAIDRLVMEVEGPAFYHPLKMANVGYMWMQTDVTYRRYTKFSEMTLPFYFKAPIEGGGN